MHEGYGPHLEELVTTVAEDPTALIYSKSLDQHTRVKDREEALEDLADRHPTTKIEIDDSLNKTGKMLLKRGDPTDNLFYDPDGPFSPILNVVANEGGSAYIPDIMKEARVSVDAIRQAQIANVLEIDSLSMKLVSRPLQEHIRGLENKGQTPPFVEPIHMRANTVYSLGVAD